MLVLNHIETTRIPRKVMPERCFKPSSPEANLEIGFALGMYSQNKLLREGGKQDQDGEEDKPG